jgi:hypothetical protein
MYHINIVELLLVVGVVGCYTNTTTTITITTILCCKRLFDLGVCVCVYVRASMG